MANIKQRVAAIQPWQREVGRKTFTRSWTVGGGRAAVPRRSIIDRVAVSVVHVEQKAVTDLLLACRLKGVVVRVDDVAPIAQVAVVVVREPAIAIPSAAEIVGYDRADR